MSGTPLLILSIFSLLCCQILSPVVIFLASNALKSGTLPAQDVGPTNIARIIGIVGTVLLVLGIIARIAGVGSNRAITPRTAPALIPVSLVQR